jgi:hypothetical protein
MVALDSRWGGVAPTSIKFFLCSLFFIILVLGKNHLLLLLSQSPFCEWFFVVTRHPICYPHVTCSFEFRMPYFESIWKTSHVTYCKDLRQLHVRSYNPMEARGFGPITLTHSRLRLTG